MAPKSNGPARAAKAAGPMAPMQAGGDSESWAGAKENQRTIFKQFLTHSATPSELRLKWGDSLEGLPEEDACSPDIYAYFATFIESVYLIPAGRKNAGKHLEVKSAVAVWSGIINQTQAIWSHKCSPEHKVRPAPAHSNQTPLRAHAILRPPARHPPMHTCAAHYAHVRPPVCPPGILRVHEEGDVRILRVVQGDQGQDDEEHLSATDGQRGAHGSLGDAALPR